MHAPQISCCFSGYRPGKLPWGNDENDPRCRALKARLRDVMEAAYDETSGVGTYGYTCSRLGTPYFFERE